MDRLIRQNATGAVIFFTTKAFNYSIPVGLSNSSAILKASNLTSLSYKFTLCFQPKQVHSSKIIVVTRKTEQIYAADGIITNDTGLFLSIKTADCVPILMYDENRKVIAAVHSGWRGTDKQIVRFCIEKLINKFKVNPKQLKVYIGPSIRDCCYEVSCEIAGRFGNYPYKTKNGKPFIDLASINRELLLNSGIKKDNIYMNTQCTGCESSRFYSWRKRKDSGRMYAVIGLPLQNRINQ
ncbi:MAG: peptidoglycan editing factor PgeF [Epsilonproteobacteria bacterium]|nr:peptidoglycan editing factor PgeF [Campylobacterota bacterium]